MPPSVLARPNFGRHASFVGPATLTGVLHVIGCGATGSFVAETAARMGFCKFDLWDADVVEPHNLANQRYEPSHVGLPKVEALAEVLRRFNPDVEITVHNEFFTEASVLTDIGPLILTTDSNSSRGTIMGAAANNPFVDTVFETSLGFHHGSAQVVDNFDADAVKNFIASLKPDDQIPEGPCNRRICTTLVGLISSYVVHQVCEMYAARSQGQQWSHKKHQLFEMGPLLRTLALA